MTNFERIKAMDIDTMVTIMEEEVCYHCEYAESDTCYMRCTEGVRKWLESEATESGSN